MMVTAAAIAARTKKIRIGTGVLLMPLHDPVRVAEDAAVVDLISGGRLILGIGLGYRPEEFEGFGRSLKERRGRMEESLEILNSSWQDGPFTFDGKYYKLENVNVTPKPVQRPIPIWIGAFTEPAIRRAARIGAPLYVPAIGIIPIVKYLFDMHGSLLREYGRNPEDFEKPLVREIYISDKTSDKIWEKIKENVTYTAKGYASWGSMVDREGNLLSDPNDPVLYDIAREQSIIGTPEECIETIKRYKDALPVNNLICRFKFPGISHDEAVRSMKLFVEKVLPAVS
jgi:alkanesulfonate monooxygenase SsuD/methylene tetrahydromethanopterin reductase-like flavin-dependent oxidoreductase (luciferase family)